MTHKHEKSKQKQNRPNLRKLDDKQTSLISNLKTLFLKFPSKLETP